MIEKQDLAFATASLDRADHLRADALKPTGLLVDEAALGYAYWRGKLLFCAPDNSHLAGLPTDHQIFSAANEPPVFLGMTAGGPRFVFDISAWEPENVPDGHGDFFDASGIQHPDVPDDHQFVDLRSHLSVISVDDSEVAATAKAILGWHESHRFCARCGKSTKPEMAGWQRQCPACGTRHFPRTDPVVIMLVTRGNSVLVGRSPGWPDGMYSLLAGFVEPGETLESAARREVFEEVGVRIGRVGYLASQPWPFPASLMVGCWCEAQNTEITIDPLEVEAARWFTREEMVDVFAGQFPGVFPARTGSIAHHLLKNWLADIPV